MVAGVFCATAEPGLGTVELGLGAAEPGLGTVDPGRGVPPPPPVPTADRGVETVRWGVRVPDGFGAAGVGIGAWMAGV